MSDDEQTTSDERLVSAREALKEWYRAFAFLLTALADLEADPERLRRDGPEPTRAWAASWDDWLRRSTEAIEAHRKARV